MTSIGGNSYRHARIEVVSWPPAEPVAGGGRVRSVWDLETLTGLDLPPGSRPNLSGASGLSSVMTFDVTVTGPRRLRMVCECDAALEEPYRFGAASVAWRRIDEDVARLWMIGARPRAVYPEFQRQRRQLLERLSPARRRTWLWLAMIRGAPLFGATADDVDTLYRTVAEDGGEALVADRFRALAARVGGSPPEPFHAAADLTAADVPWLLTGAAEAAVAGGSVNDLAAASERLFDALFLVDRAAAEAEDIAWFAVCHLLGDDALTASIDASRTVSSLLLGDSPG